MATTVTERWQGRACTTDEKGVKTLAREWVVTTDDDATGPGDAIDLVVAAAASAALYAAHPQYAWAVCRKLTSKPNGGPRVWLVEASYSSSPFEAKGTGTGTGPNSATPSPQQANSTPADQRPPTFSVSRKEITEPLEFDTTTDERVTNTVGDPFDPPVEVFRSHHVLTWKFHRKPAQLNWPVRSAFMDSVNADPYVILGRTYPAGTLRCTDVSLGSVWETGATGLAFFWEVTVQAEYDPNGWQPRILNAGRRKKQRKPGASLGDPDAWELVPILDSAGKPVADPVPLDANGAPVPPGGTYHYVEPEGYVPRDWTLLID